MKPKNANLHKAKKAANDEFYTQYEDIAKEIEHYKEHLKVKWFIVIVIFHTSVTFISIS